MIIKVLLDMLSEIILGLVEGILTILNNLFSKNTRTAYTAEFGKPQIQLQRKGGFRIGYKYGTDFSKNPHLICFGGSGSLKSVSICFTTLLQTRDCSYVVLDISRELYNGTAQHLSSIGFSVYVLDYENWQQSIGFSVLAKCKNEADFIRVAEVTVLNSLKDGHRDYWSESAINILSLFAFILFRYADPKYLHFGSVLAMLEVFSFDPERIDKWLAGRCQDVRILNRYKALLVTPEKTLLSTVSTAINALAAYKDEAICAITSQDTLDFENFRQRNCILFLCGSPTMASMTKGVTASLFDAFFAHVLQKIPSPKSKRIAFIIDEAANIRLEDSLPRILELGRKYRINVATLWQDFGQIQHIYNANQASNIMANSAVKVFMPSGQPLATCRMLSELLGRFQYETEDGRSVKTRELLTVQEVFQLDKLLVLNSNNKPLLLEPRPFFLNRKLNRLANLPVYKYCPEKVLSKAEIIDFN